MLKQQKFDSIQIEAHWFDEGQFWNIGINGYVDEDQPINLNGITSTNILPAEFDKDDVVDELKMLAEIYLLPSSDMKTEKVTILVDGNEIETIPNECADCGRTKKYFMESSGTSLNEVFGCPECDD